MDLYSKYIGRVDSKLNVEQITIHQLETVLQTMRPTTSSAEDFLSIRIIKDAAPVINPLILHLINSVIKTEKFPDKLKLTKIVPNQKGGLYFGFFLGGGVIFFFFFGGWGWFFFFFFFFTVQYCTVQYSTVQYNTVQYSTVQYTVQ